jgi:hypothetical protein
MMKKVAVALLCTALGNTLYARDDISTSSPFLGLEIGYATIKADAYNYFSPNIYPGYESSDIEFGARIGAQKENWRTMLVYNYFDTDNANYTQTYHKGLLTIDYMFTVSEGTENVFKPYLGLNVGYMAYETGDTPYKSDADGFIAGGQVGFTYRVMEKIDLDLMYRYSAGINVTDGSDDANRVDGIGSAILGINYLY